MKSIKFAAAIAFCAVLGSPVYAADAQSFTAMQGVEAQALSSPEMDAVYGQLTLSDLYAEIALVTNPFLKSYLTSTLNYLVAKYPNSVNTVLAYFTARGF